MKFITIGKEKAYQCYGYKNYYVTPSGDIYSTYVRGGRGQVDINSPHKLAYGQDRDGYFRVVLCENGEKKYIKVHTVVVETFIGRVIPPNVVNHKDGNKKNNDISNLEIVSVKDNTNHAHKIGLCHSDNAVSVLAGGQWYNFFSMQECTEHFPDLTVYYLQQIKRKDVLYSMILFEKATPEKRYSAIMAYYNGELYKTFDSLIDADKFFNKSRGTTWSALKNCEYRKRINKYHVVFPNVSTIESTQKYVEASRVHCGETPQIGSAEV